MNKDGSSLGNLERDGIGGLVWDKLGNWITDYSGHIYPLTCMPSWMPSNMVFLLLWRLAHMTFW